VPPLLAVRGLSLHYPNGTRALENVDLDVYTGALTVVLGGNGCGKTTLLRCINRALTSASGEVWLDGGELTPLSGKALRRARLDIAMIWRQANLIRRRGVAANVAAGALGRHQTLWTALGGLPANEMRAARSHLGGVGLAHLADRRASTLSGGQAPGFQTGRLNREDRRPPCRFQIGDMLDGHDRPLVDQPGEAGGMDLSRPRRVDFQPTCIFETIQQRDDVGGRGRL
jgi:ABC-type branched-subunit amino acid transport system ATPase component